jgi:hypothetical protein
VEAVAAREAFRLLGEEHSDKTGSASESDGKRIVTGEEAAKHADTPHLTGDPEWDAVELAETAAR